MSFLVVSVIGLGLMLLLSIILMLILAGLQWHFTRIEKGNTAFIVRGDDMKAIWPNVGGHRMSSDEDLDGRRWLIRTDSDTKIRETFTRDMLPETRWLQNKLWDWFGIRFVSWFYPQVRVHKLKLDVTRLKEESRVETGKTLRERLEGDTETIYSLRFLVPRPMVIEGVELAGDNARINLLVLAIFRTVIPSLPIFYYKGRFFPLLDAGVKAGIINFCANYKFPVPVLDERGEPVFDKNGKTQLTRGESLTYELWLRLDKGVDSPIQKSLLGLNVGKDFYDSLVREKKTELVDHIKLLLGGKEPEEIPDAVKEKMPFGFIRQHGFALQSIEVIDWEAAEETKDLSSALRAKQTAFHKAKGVREEAYGRRDAVEAVGNADAARIGKMVEAVVRSLEAKGVLPDQIAEVIKSVFQAEQLKQIPNLQTLILGGAGTMAMVPTSMPIPPPPANP
ncbi:MAG: hypothetical protein HYT46_01810 [Candidatus Vogelbacteria bacterium]|nr:hypothetical protein [Candidatus Vogelbacteria bacterium]